MFYVVIYLDINSDTLACCRTWCIFFLPCILV